MGISEKEKFVIAYIFDNIKCYQVTRTLLGKYNLYKITDGMYQKITTSDTPSEFYNIALKDRSESNGN